MGLGKALNCFPCIHLKVLQVPLGTCGEPGTFLSVFRVSYPHNIRAKWQLCPHFQDEQVETLKAHEACPRSHLQQLGSQGKILTQICPIKSHTAMPSSLPTSESLSYSMAAESFGRACGALEGGRARQGSRVCLSPAQVSTLHPVSY